MDNAVRAVARLPVLFGTVTIVKHVDAADEYNFASDLAPFIKEIVDQGATLELSDDWKELLQET